MRYYGLKDSNGIPLDKKLDELFKHKSNGIYIELGANNGILQSNTYFFEKNRNWNGVLIEASPILYEMCKNNRPNSKCYNYACVSNDYNKKTVLGDFNFSNPKDGLMSSINSVRRSRYKNNLIEVSCNNLTNILIDSKISTSIDLLSLDVEGHEYQVLKGLDFNKYKINYLLIEIYNKDFNNITSYLNENNYSLKENFSNYNKLNNSKWDGTHNDYLFKLN
jgi:FkbM family methyltransferase